MLIDPKAPATSDRHPARAFRDEVVAAEVQAAQARHAEQDQRDTDEDHAEFIDHLALTYAHDSDGPLTDTVLLERARDAQPAGNATRAEWIAYYPTIVPGTSTEDAEKLKVPQMRENVAALLEQQPGDAS